MKTKSFLNQASPNFQILLTIIFLGSFLVAYFPVWRGLVLAWNSSEDYSHGFLILPICLYILWQKRATLRAIPARPSWAGLPVVVFSLLAYLFAHMAEMATVASLSIISLAGGTIIYLFGFATFRACSFPLFLLFFMIPPPAQVYVALTLPLQLFVSKVVGVVAPYLHVPLYQEGNIIHLPSQTLQVVTACSGLRSIISLMTLGAVFGYFTLRKNSLRAALLLGGLPVAIFVNIVRVLLIVFCLYHLDIDLTGDSVHTWFGMGNYVLALALILVFRKGLSLWDRPAKEE